MASRIQTALQSNPQAAASRLRGGSLAGANYQAAQVGTPNNVKSGLLDSLENFGKSAGAAFGRYEDEQEKAGKQQAEWLTKFARENPDEYRKAFNDGTLRYQDNKFAMQFMRENMGSNASFRADAEIQQRIKDGKYGSFSKEDEVQMNKDKAELRKLFAEQDAKLYGIDTNDEHFQFGLASNIQQREISTNDVWDSHKAQFNENAAIVNAKQTLSGSLHGLNATNGEQYATSVTGYLEQTRQGALLNDKQRESVLLDAVKNTSNHAQGGAALVALGEQEVELYGRRVKIKDYVGKESWDSYLANANQSLMTQDRERASIFESTMGGIERSTDINLGLEELRKQRDFYNKMQPGSAQTAALDRIDRVEQSLKDRLARETAKKTTENDKANQKFNRETNVYGNITRAMNGDFAVPLSTSTMPTDDNTGEYKEEDFTNAFNKYRNDIMNDQNLTPEQKAQQWMKLASVSGKTGWPQKVMAPSVEAATNDLSGAILRGAELKGTELDQLKAYYEADPAGFVKLFPEQGELIAQMYTMKKYGLTNEQFVKGERERNSLSKKPDKGAASYENFLTNSGQYPHLNYMSHDEAGAAYQVYLAEMHDHGDTQKALKAADRMAEGFTTTFSAGGSGNTAGRLQGAIPTSFLENGNGFDATNGKRHMEGFINQVATEGKISSAYVNVNYNADQDIVLITGAAGQMPKIISRADMIEAQKAEDDANAELAVKQQEKQKAELEKTLANANKKAPIVAAKAAREAGSKRVRAKKAQVPNSIYGGEIRKDLQSGEPIAPKPKQKTAKAPKDTKAKINRLID
ncbi:putative internal virion protein [Escherichia phage P1723]|uniref:Putative internal virion protein n=1 Tax=Escherichia phage P1723 TaxID=2736274 RepID=A0A6M9QBH8_9CAUD|nr:putative internal virion protein [Escherichia phage P1723]